MAREIALPTNDGWVDVGRLSDLDPVRPTFVAIDGRELALCRLGGRVYAIGNECTHAGARLCDGIVDGTEIYCPLHQGSFDIRTGQAVMLPCEEPVPTYAVKVEDDRIFVDVTRPAG